MRSPLSPRRPSGRLLISAALGVIAFLWLTPSRIEWPVRAIAGWDAGALVQLAFAWTIILRADAKSTRRRAGEDDPGHYMVFVFAVVASLISLFAASVVLRAAKALPGAAATWWTVLTLAAVALSWVLTHTGTRSVRAPALPGQRPRQALGRRPQFCGTEEPSDIDFAYFAFTIGMCFQVSDVVVLSTGMRREVLLHAVLSFVYNTVILALALNLVVSVMS